MTVFKSLHWLNYQGANIVNLYLPKLIAGDGCEAVGKVLWYPCSVTWFLKYVTETVYKYCPSDYNGHGCLGE